MQNPMISEVRYEPYDVLVAGGGLAGLTAAIAAARGGARTVLIERAGWLGGMGITGATGLHTFFNIYGAHPGAERLRVVRGIPQELIDRTGALGGAMGHVPMERGADFVSMLTPVDPEAFKAAALEACREAGVRLLLHTVIDEVVAGDGAIEGVVVWNKAGRSLIRAEQYIDCTGDGDLAAWAGAPFEHYRADDPGAYSAGFTFRLCNVDLAALEGDLERRGAIRQLAHAVKPHTQAPDLVRLGIDVRRLREQGIEGPITGFLSSSVRPREITYCNCINYGPNDGLDPDALTAAEVDLRGRMLSVADMFRENLAGCEGCYAAGPAPTAGQRRGRAIHADYEITQDDCTDAHKFGDAVGCYSFIDNGRHFVRDAGYYQIPYRALIPREVDNLLMAGRMMTVELVAHNSTRNTVCCMICGQAAGTAAALAVHAGVTPREVDVEALQARLRAADVLLEPVAE
ncbi:MAG: FAD-dependent oxidoreductase [Chloroflexi bacterium]|nr:FAD-dependent oxidoreductase [Chloroflexota bacterium]